FDTPLGTWFDTRGWTPASFQREAWRRWRRGESGLLVTPTGSGKTLAALGGPLLDALDEACKAAAKAARAKAPARSKAASKTTTPRKKPAGPRTRLRWTTPPRALARDTVRALREPVEALGLDWTVAMRTGDASSRDRRLARQGRADALVITPESLALLLSYPDTAAQLAGLRGIVVDEWHE